MKGKKLLIVCLLLCCVGLSAKLTNAQTMDDLIATYKYPVKHFSVDDSTRLAFIEVGNGPKTLIFVHGLATYLPSWYPTIEALKTDYRCIAIDLPGYGRSSKGNYPATMSYYAGVINQFVSSQALQNVVLVGHSMGGQVALTTVLQAPDAYEKLALLAPAGFETFKEEQKAWLKAVFTPEFTMNATDAQVRANWQLNFFDMPETVEFMIEDRLAMKKATDFEAYCQTVAKGVAGMLDEPVFDRLKDIQLPTLVVYGANDQLIPNRYLNPTLTTEAVARTGADQMPHAQPELIQNCGHFISFDQPAEINELLRVFLNK